MKTITPSVQRQWQEIAPLLTIRNEQDYDSGIARLNALLDEVGTDETHPLYTLLDTLSIIIFAYEEENHPIPDSSGAEILSYLMEEHTLAPSDLPEVGNQALVMAILDGKQELNVQQIRALATRFKVSPSVFI